MQFYFGLNIFFIFNSVNFYSTNFTAMKRVLLIMLAVCMSFPVFAQRTLDLVSLTGRYGLPQEYKETYSGTATEFGSINSITAGIRLSNKNMIPISFNHFYFNVQGDPEIPEDLANPIVINGFILRTGWYQRFGNGHALQLLIAPRIMSDFKNMDGNSFQMGGVLTYEKEFNDDLTMAFGAIYNQELFGPYLVPLVDLHWQISPKWRIDGMIPVTLRVVYSVNDNMSVGFNHFGLITTYYLGNDSYTGDYMERQSIDLSLFLRQRLGGNFFVEGMVGRTMGRSYKQYAGDQKVSFALPLVTFGDTRVVKNETFGDGMILTLKLVYNISFPAWE